MLSTSFPRHRAATLGVVLLGAVALPAVALAQSATVRPAVIAGRVADERGAPVPAARVALPALGRTTTTDATGRFVFRGLRAEQVALQVTQIGYAPRRLTLDLASSAGSDSLWVDVRLEQVAVSLGGVQVTATPSGRDPLAVAQSTTTVSGKELERTAGATLGATLAVQPGITARSMGPGASAPIIRGLSGDRVLVLQDGHRSGDLASTAPDHGVTIDPSAAQRVEIVRGPAALLYGNNALGGVVNVISDDVPGSRPARPYGSASITGESVAPGGALHLEGSTPVGGRGVLRVRAGTRTHGDVRLGRGWIAGRLTNTDYRNDHAVVGAALVGDRGTAGAAYRGYRFAYGLPTPIGDEANAVTLRGRRDELIARAERTLAGTPLGSWLDAARVEASAQRYHHDEVVANGVVGTRLELQSQTAQATLRTRALGPLRDGAFGASVLLRQNGVTGTQALTPANDAASVGGYLFQELALGRRGSDPVVRIPVGLRYDRFTIRSHASEKFGPGRQRAFDAVSGSVGVNVPLATGASLGVTLARAVRSPTAEELFSMAGHTGTGAFEIGDPNLAAETNSGADVVLRVERQRLTAQLSAYHNRIDRYIGLYPTGRDTVVPDGAGGTKSLPLFVVSQRPATLRGLEGTVERVVREHLVLGLVGDLLHARDGDGGPLPFMPAGRVGGSARYDDGTFSLGGSVRHALAQGVVPDGELPARAHTLTDLHAGVRIARGARIHAITLRSDNAANVLYRDATSRIKAFAPSPGRNFMLTYKVVF